MQQGTGGMDEIGPIRGRGAEAQDVTEEQWKRGQKRRGRRGGRRPELVGEAAANKCKQQANAQARIEEYRFRK